MADDPRVRKSTQPPLSTENRGALISFIHLVAILVVIFIATIAWAVLGDVISRRTDTASKKLGGSVAALWGGPQYQRPPRVTIRFLPVEGIQADPAAESPSTENSENQDASASPGIAIEKAGTSGKTPPASGEIPLERSQLEILLSLEHRKKGLLWYNTYRAKVRAEYVVSNDQGVDGIAHFQFPLPARGGIYDDFRLSIDGIEQGTFRQVKEGGNRIPSLAIPLDLPAGSSRRLVVRYSTQGLDRWDYGLSEAGGQVRNFTLTATTDFDDVDFPATAMSPTHKQRENGGWSLRWEFESLVGGRDISILMPSKLNPGPLAAKISRFAPVSLVFFFGVLFFLYLLRGIPLHPVHYLFLAAAFFSFHLLFAHLVDHLDLYLSFTAASLVSVFLVVSYLRLVVGSSFAFFQAGGLQLLYLVFFSFAHFYEGWTGLTVTVGAIVTLFVVMQLTAKLDWNEVIPLSRRHRAITSEKTP